MTGKIRYLGFALLAALLTLTLISCRDLEKPPVFYTLSQEEPLGDDRGFPDESSVFKMVKITVGLDDYYLAAAGRLYIRGTGDSDNWTVVTPPAGLANAMCNRLELLAGFLYAGFFNSSDGTGYGLYRASVASLPLVWNPVAAMQNTEIALLKDVGGQLFVATNTAGNVNALYYGDGATFTAVGWTVDPPEDLGIIDVAQDSSSSSYWVLVGAYLYRSAALPGPFAVFDTAVMNPLDNNVPLSGVIASGGLFDDGTALYVSGGNGHLYRTLDGGALWTRTAEANRILDDDDDPVHFTAFTSPSPTDAAIYVGTQGQGYYRIPGGDVTGTLTREPAYSIAPLYNGALYYLYYDSANATLFLCTGSSGLWRGTGFDPGVVEWTWRQE